ncbi:hypothetical protein OsI_01686 [Oryza sativa Indica Group]|uniref:Uncharacterized protein n=1 Tax=Oryza sativa subsp. indica TaxID=39946 RepID=B8A759_ORYSI|nr:hypothetical protein OsI_01686 [Oryza sativa Indica Group]
MLTPNSVYCTDDTVHYIYHSRFGFREVHCAIILQIEQSRIEHMLIAKAKSCAVSLLDESFSVNAKRSSGVFHEIEI